LVLAPIVFAGKKPGAAEFGVALQATACFCLASGALYVLNDWWDRAEDREHPVKCRRPIAAGTVSGRAAAVVGGLAFAGAVLAAASLRVEAVAVLFLYAAIVVTYSRWLKHIAIADVIVVAVGFVLRVIFGGLANRIVVSHWLLLCTFLVAMFLATGKRRAELISAERRGHFRRVALQGYTVHLADQMASSLLGATIVCYCLYTVAPETVLRVGSGKLLFTVPFVVFGLFRYLQLGQLDPDRTGDPSEAVTRDLPLLLAVLLWMAAVGAILYWRA